MMPTPSLLPTSTYLLLSIAECLFGAAHACIKGGVCSGFGE